MLFAGKPLSTSIAEPASLVFIPSHLYLFTTRTLLRCPERFAFPHRGKEPKFCLYRSFFSAWSSAKRSRASKQRERRGFQSSAVKRRRVKKSSCKETKANSQKLGGIALRTTKKCGTWVWLSCMRALAAALGQAVSISRSGYRE